MMQSLQRDHNRIAHNQQAKTNTTAKKNMTALKPSLLIVLFLLSQSSSNANNVHDDTHRHQEEQHSIVDDIDNGYQTTAATTLSCFEAISNNENNESCIIPKFEMLQTDHDYKLIVELPSTISPSDDLNVHVDYDTSILHVTTTTTTTPSSSSKAMAENNDFLSCINQSWHIETNTKKTNHVHLVDLTMSLDKENILTVVVPKPSFTNNTSSPPPPPLDNDNKEKSQPPRFKIKKIRNPIKGNPVDPPKIEPKVVVVTGKKPQNKSISKNNYLRGAVDDGSSVDQNRVNGSAMVKTTARVNEKEEIKNNDIIATIPSSYSNNNDSLDTAVIFEQQLKLKSMESSKMNKKSNEDKEKIGGVDETYYLLQLTDADEENYWYRKM